MSWSRSHTIPTKAVQDLKPERTLTRDEKDVDCQTTPSVPDGDEALTGLVLDQQEIAIAAAQAIVPRLERTYKCSHVCVSLGGHAGDNPFVNVHVAPADPPEDQTAEAAQAAVAPA